MKTLKHIASYEYAIQSKRNFCISLLSSVAGYALQTLAALMVFPWLYHLITSLLYYGR